MCPEFCGEEGPPSDNLLPFHLSWPGRANGWAGRPPQARRRRERPHVLLRALGACGYRLHRQEEDEEDEEDEEEEEEGAAARTVTAR
ncbi:hypothetical protein S40293_10443 [Stachybotrys chartarum IBT 40293]|nr:hypothetical protein S40293_10443 [Stachybotrys chartarum IBT 40293]